MISFEREIREYLKAKNVTFIDYGASYDQPDFEIKGRTTTFLAEAKEKRQTYSTSTWPINFPETKAFILDELTARKLMMYPQNGCLVIRDNTTGLYYFTDPVRLWLMPRTRCERNHNGFMKGKWVLNFDSFMQSDRLSDLFVWMRDWVNESKELFSRDAHLHAVDIPGETIVEAGTPRTEEQKEHDVQETR